MRSYIDVGGCLGIVTRYADMYAVQYIYMMEESHHCAMTRAQTRGICRHSCQRKPTCCMTCAREIMPMFSLHFQHRCGVLLVTVSTPVPQLPKTPLRRAVEHLFSDMRTVSPWPQTGQSCVWEMYLHMLPSEPHGEQGWGYVTGSEDLRT